MRKNESENVVEVFGKQLDANLVYVDATDRFLDKLAGVADPEEKRMIIGSEFIRVFEEEARKLEGIEFLGQGTIYPDIIEKEEIHLLLMDIMMPVLDGITALAQLREDGNNIRGKRRSGYRAAPDRQRRQYRHPLR